MCARSNRVCVERVSPGAAAQESRSERRAAESQEGRADPEAAARQQPPRRAVLPAPGPGPQRTGSSSVDGHTVGILSRRGGSCTKTGTGPNVSAVVVLTNG